MTILFIDDDSEDIELLCEAVNYLNNSELISSNKVAINCLTATDGRKAVDLLLSLSEMPDYIFSDINMPVMDGKKCLKFLKSDPRFSGIPVIVLSTAFRSDDTTELKALGAADCVLKPTKFKDLVKILSRYVFKKCLADQLPLNQLPREHDLR